jgi:NAD(P)-dependent dehydrogenase (short-subunit alcohol dehydrogenase family)
MWRSRRAGKALLEVQAGLEGRGGGVRSMVAATDVADRDQVRSLVARTEEELGPVDVLVNCAGVMYYTLVYYTEYTTLHSEIPCPIGRREARGALRAGCSG